jgi:hypothetical protein
MESYKGGRYIGAEATGSFYPPCLKFCGQSFNAAFRVLKSYVHKAVTVRIGYMVIIGVGASTMFAYPIFTKR